jgi:hypothetical protein
MDILAAPLGALIASVGRSVADAQQAIDACSLDQFVAVYDPSVNAFEPLRAIRYQPTWYQVAEANAEIKLAFTVTRSQPRSAWSAPANELFVAPVDAGYRSRFGYAQKAASSLKFRIVPVPPPAAAAPPDSNKR